MTLNNKITHRANRVLLTSTNTAIFFFTNESYQLRNSRCPSKEMMMEKSLNALKSWPNALCCCLSLFMRPCLQKTSTDKKLQCYWHSFCFSSSTYILSKYKNNHEKKKINSNLTIYPKYWLIFHKSGNITQCYCI